MSLIHRALAFGIAAGCVAIPGAAPAELGGPISSVTTDRARMSARLNTVSTGRYTRHELTRPNGAMVREFTNADGTVFAVTWSGPGKPDLRTLLGRYFATFQANSVATARTMHSLRRPLKIAQTDLQIQVEGHMGWFRGVAYVRSLAPTGFAVSDLSEQP
jgi:hypothetical protein